MPIKKKLMELMWRMQQSQAIIGVLMWSLTLTGIFYPYLRDKFGLASSNVLLPMMALFLIILAGVVLIGIIFDRFAFWKEQNIVLAERNPYCTYKLYPKEVFYARLWLLTAKQISEPSEELKREIKFWDAWLKRLMTEDPIYRGEVEEVEGYVAGKGGPPRDAPGPSSK
jgi:hypothetical protein